MKPVPICPKCGCPARHVIFVRARVVCDLFSDGTVGRTVSLSRDNDAKPLEYQCAGWHQWPADSDRKSDV